MRIHLYTHVYNEMPMLEFFFRHYGPIVERYFVMEDFSTDGTREALEARPDVTFMPFERPDPLSVELSRQVLVNRQWKASRGQADWVIVCDIDEILWHPQLETWLDQQMRAGVTAIPALGFQMLSEDFPPSGVALPDWLMRGAPWRQMNKLALFRPDQITDTRYSLGSHTAAPQGNVVYPDRDALCLLHYKYLGMDHILSRHAQARAKRLPTDLKRNLGHRYGFSPEQVAADFADFASRAVDVAALAAADRLSEDHTEPRWWRG